MSILEKINLQEDGNNVLYWSDGGGNDRNLTRFVQGIESNLSGAEIVKDSRSVKAGICKFENMLIFVKRYNDRGVAHRIKYTIKKPRALNSIRIFSYLKSQNIGFKIPRHIVAICASGVKKKVSYLLQESVENLLSTQDICRYALSSESAKVDFIRSLSMTLAQMHEAGVVHGDMKLSNFFFSGKLDDYRCGVWDFDVARISRKMFLRTREKELARTVASFLEITGKISNGISKDEILDLFSENYEKFSGMKPRLKKMIKFVNAFTKKDN